MFGIDLILIIGAVVLIGILFLVLTFNSLITLKNRIDNAWAQIDVQLKKRSDLIPNLPRCSVSAI